MFIYYFSAENVLNEETLAAFIRSELESNQEVIEDLSAAQIQHLIDTENYVVVIACKALLFSSYVWLFTASTCIT